MLRRALICLFIFSWISSSATADVPAQDSAPVALLKFAGNLFDAGNYQQAITEYRRFLFFHPQDSLGFFALYSIGRSYFELGEFQIASRALRQALRLPADPALKQKARYQLALVLVHDGKYDLAQIEFFKISRSGIAGDWRDAAQMLYAVMLLLKGQWDKADHAFAGFAEQVPRQTPASEYLAAIRRDLSVLKDRPLIKSTDTARKLSTVLPGAGQMYAGEFWNGVNALLINTGTSFLVWRELRDEDYSDSVLLFGLLWWRFYSGNRWQAEEAAKRANERYSEDYRTRILTSVTQLVDLIPERSLTIDLTEALSK